MHRVLNCLLVVAIVTAVGPAAAPAQPPNKPPASEKNPDARPTKSAPARPADADRFELKEGDRVVFIGNTFFEREGRYGYIETMLTTRYPGKRITFRNLGWSGDTVWGESRGYFEPEKGYQNLINLVAELRPTVIFLAYGNNEAFAGKEGLEPFIKQYNKLLDDLEQLRKTIVILSTVRQVPKPSTRNSINQINQMLEKYDAAIHDLAMRRAYPFIDASGFWSSDLVGITPQDSDNGIHGTDAGYHAAAYQIRNLAINNDLPQQRVTVGDITVDNSGKISADGTTVRDAKLTPDKAILEIVDPLLPLPPDVMVQRGARQRNITSHRFLELRNLSAGKYRCLIDGDEVATITISNRPGATGVPTIPEERQVEQLRATIIEKNQLFFHRWRPQNTTYLLGFRKHEQGQNAKEIAQFDPLIAAKEEEIFKLAQPVPHKYELIRVKDDQGKNKQFDRGKAGVEQGGK